MNVDQLHKTLVKAARAHPPSDHVPYGFAGRVVARLSQRPALDVWALWAHALWRAAAPCVGVMLLFGVWSWFSSSGNAGVNDLSQDFENTVLIAADQEAPPDTLW